LAEREGFENETDTSQISKLLMRKESCVPTNPLKPPALSLELSLTKTPEPIESGPYRESCKPLLRD